MNVATIMRMALALNSQIAFRVFNLYHWLATEGVIGVVRSVILPFDFFAPHQLPQFMFCNRIAPPISLGRLLALSTQAKQ
jgi:hypothetical protein